MISRFDELTTINARVISSRDDSARGEAALPHIRSALLLSGGGNLGNFHVGVISALLQAGLLPTVVAGSSAGAFIAAVCGTRTDEDLLTLFADGAPALAAPDDEIERGRLDSGGLRRTISRLIPDVTFAEAAAISGRATHVSLSAPKLADGSLLCGPRSTPNVLLRDAVLASCAVPFLFAPVILNERIGTRICAFGEGRSWVDGSVHADLPITALRTEYRIDYCIVSLVNPFVLPFISDPTTHGPMLHKVVSGGTGLARSAVTAALSLWRILALVIKPLEPLIDTAQRVVQQRYTGDVVIAPTRRLHELRRIIDHPTRELVRRLAAEGELATRVRLPVIRTMLAG